ncbi:uncharacterized protein METZ01_LOCUS195122 [marine metagenome]|uniref:Uncharacterized protein n=1 Tax=marine metagenome TaxID=408172 RepID=A0A382DV64_9ZZZZ
MLSMDFKEVSNFNSLVHKDIVTYL